MILLTIVNSLPPAAPWQVDCHPGGYDEAGRQQMRNVPGIKWIRDPKAPNGRGYYRGPRDAVRQAAELLAAAGVAKINDRSAEPAGIFGWLHDPTAAMRSYQLRGAGWIAGMLAASGAALLADEMGLGKSIQAVKALDAVAPEGPVLVICPAVVVPHWEKQFALWAINPDRFTAISYGKLEKLPPEEWAAVVIDEIHYVSNPKAKRTLAVQKLIAKPLKRPLLVGLSGTPMTARPRDLHAPLELLWPGRFGDWFSFTRRYCDGHYNALTRSGLQPVDRAEPGEVVRKVWDSSGASRQDELAERLKAVMLRRTKADSGVNLPPLMREVIEVDLSATALRAIAKASQSLCGKESLAEVLSLVELHKLSAAEELAQDAIANGHRPLVLTLRKQSAAKLASSLGVTAVDGEMQPAERLATLTSPGAACGVATLYSVTTGIDLTCYDTVIIVGLDWLPSTLRQAEARPHRIGQRRSVQVYYLVGRGTVDEVVRERVIERLDNTEAILGDDNAGMGDALRGGSEADLIAAIVAAVKGA